MIIKNPLTFLRDQSIAGTADRGLRGEVCRRLLPCHPGSPGRAARGGGALLADIEERASLVSKGPEQGTGPGHPHIEGGRRPHYLGQRGGCFLPEGQLQRHTTGPQAQCQARRCRLGIPGGRVRSGDPGLWLGVCVRSEDPERSAQLEQAGPGATSDQRVQLKTLHSFLQVSAPPPHPRHWRRDWGRRRRRGKSLPCRC